jgi:hypothetical protein
MKTAEDIRQDVIDEMTWERSLDTPGIGVAVHGDTVTLTGHVRSYAEKRAAEKAVKRVHGVIAVANDLEVRLPSSLQRDDTISLQLPRRQSSGRLQCRVASRRPSNTAG